MSGVDTSELQVGCSGLLFSCLTHKDECEQPHVHAARDRRLPGLYTFPTVMDLPSSLKGLLVGDLVMEKKQETNAAIKIFLAKDYSWGF